MKQTGRSLIHFEYQLMRHSNSVKCLLAVLPLLAGCAHLTYVASEPAGYIHANRPPSVVVSTRDGARIGVAEPVIVGDSLTGLSGTRQESERVSIPLNEITGVFVREMDGGRTAFAVAAGLAALYLVYLFSLASETT